MGVGLIAYLAAVSSGLVSLGELLGMAEEVRRRATTELRLPVVGLILIIHCAKSLRVTQNSENQTNGERSEVHIMSGMLEGSS